ncbi:MAG: universal stress protein [Polaromonas sp.]|nr:universal stress protein [Polaromonas sp.]
MFKHVLLPTDGSPVSDAAIQKIILFAREVQASVSGVHVMPEFNFLFFEPMILEDSRAQFAQENLARSTQVLAALQAVANAAGVACQTVSVTSDHPHEAILKVAEKRGCDLIAMASHGRKGIRGFLLGSETQKVLAHSSLPVLVFR